MKETANHGEAFAVRRDAVPRTDNTSDATTSNERKLVNLPRLVVSFEGIEPLTLEGARGVLIDSLFCVYCIVKENTGALQHPMGRTLSQEVPHSKLKQSL